MIKPRCLIGAHDSRDSFQADFAALRKWLPRNPQVRGAINRERPAGRPCGRRDRPAPDSPQCHAHHELPRVAERSNHPLKRHAVVRCPRRRTADGASMENITPPGTPAKRALAVLDNPLPETAGPQLAAA